MDGNSVQILSTHISSLQRFSVEEFEQEFQNPYGFIYLVTNLINDKIYVGRTIRDPIIRWKEHVGAAIDGNSPYLFHRAIRKYDMLNFEIEVLHTCVSEQDLKEKEILCIQEYHALDKQRGYNTEDGGGRATATDYTTRAKASRSLAGTNHPRFGKSLRKTWEEKYGKEEADTRYQVYLVKSRAAARLGNLARKDKRGCFQRWKDEHGEIYAIQRMAEYTAKRIQSLKANTLKRKSNV